MQILILKVLRRFYYIEKESFKQKAVLMAQGTAVEATLVR